MRRLRCQNGSLLPLDCLSELSLPSPCLTDCTPLPFLPPEDSIAMQGDGLQAIVGHVLAAAHKLEETLLVLQEVPAAPGRCARRFCTQGCPWSTGSAGPGLGVHYGAKASSAPACDVLYLPAPRASTELCLSPLNTFSL